MPFLANYFWWILDFLEVRKVQWVPPYLLLKDPNFWAPLRPTNTPLLPLLPPPLWPMPQMAGPPMLHTLPNMGVPPQCPPLSGVSPHRLRLLSGQHMLPHPHPLVWPHPLFTLPQPRPHQVIGQLARLSHLHQSNSSVRKLAFMPVKYKGKWDTKLYIPSTASTLNTDYLLWHTQLIVCTVKY